MLNVAKLLLQSWGFEEKHTGSTVVFILEFYRIQYSLEFAWPKLDGTQH